MRPLPRTVALLLAGMLTQPACRCGDRPSRRPSPAPVKPPASSAVPERRPARPAPARPDALSLPGRPPSHIEKVPPTSPASAAEPTVASAAPIGPVDAGTLAPVPGLRRRGGRLDIDVHKVDVRRLLTQIAAFTGTNIVMFDDVKGTVTVQVRGVPLSLAVAMVARAVGCRADLTGGMILIRCTPETKPSPKPVRGPDFP